MDYFLLLPKVIIWWYAQGLEDYFEFFKSLLKNIVSFFSVKTLFLTLFSPWKKMIGERGKGIDGLEAWLVDNLVSRFVGFFVRLVMIVIFILLMIIYLIMFVLALIAWLLFPLILLLLLLNIFIGVL